MLAVRFIHRRCVALQQAWLRHMPSLHLASATRVSRPRRRSLSCSVITSRLSTALKVCSIEPAEYKPRRRLHINDLLSDCISDQDISDARHHAQWAVTNVARKEASPYRVPWRCMIGAWPLNFWFCHQYSIAILVLRSSSCSRLTHHSVQ